MTSSLVTGLGQLLICLFLLVSVFNLKHTAEASLRNLLNSDSAKTIPIDSRQYRTAYHFQPARNWINDPNGPMYYKGFYHFFYQYNPSAAVWGNISWGHSVSKDLIRWSGIDVALSPTDPFDSNGCFSGSVTILPGKGPVIVYTGVVENNMEVQNIALPKDLSDPYLREWIKPAYNPIIKPDGMITASQFRDPSTAWLGKDGLWRITVGAQIGGKGGWALLYRSKDFVNWVQSESPLYGTDGSGMWECPDFYSFSRKETKTYVLKMSLGDFQSDNYLLGRYDEEKDLFVPDNITSDHRMWRRYDYGKFYASKSFLDDKQQRRILWGWVKEADTEEDDKQKGWAGIQSFPRVVSLDTNGRQLVQWPIEELELLRKNEKYLHDIELNAGGRMEIKGTTVHQADVEVEFEFSLGAAEPFNQSWVLDPQDLCSEKGPSVNGLVGPFGLLVLASHNLEEHTAIFFRVFEYGKDYKVLMCSDLRNSSVRAEVDKPVYGAFVDTDIKKDGKITLRTLIDHSVIESFGAGGRTCITSRVYPTLPFGGDGHLYAFNNGNSTIKISKLRAWDLATSLIS